MSKSNSLGHPFLRYPRQNGQRAPHTPPFRPTRSNRGWGENGSRVSLPTSPAEFPDESAGGPVDPEYLKRCADMEVFDGLPLVVRRALIETGRNFSAKNVAAAVANHGAHFVAGHIRALDQKRTAESNAERGL